jgi:hypothetical protein
MLMIRFHLLKQKTLLFKGKFPWSLLGMDELFLRLRFQNVLRESIGQTLQLSFAPNLDMSLLAGLRCYPVIL